MAQITSREELEAWLKDKPADWAQVIAVWVALLVFPEIFRHPTQHAWINRSSLMVFRAASNSWAAGNFLSNVSSDEAVHSGMALAYMSPGAALAAKALVSSTYAVCASSQSDAVGAAVTAVGSVLELFKSSTFADNSRSANPTPTAYPVGEHESILWRNISTKCRQLSSSSSTVGENRKLMQNGLWSAGQPENWSDDWQSAATRLLTLDPTYQVWIDWYNRRIEGHDAAFAIPGDTGRIEDKKILIRLADATNEDFWDKGATYVNTTLQSWIDAARARVAEPSEPEAQNTNVIQFRQNDVGQFDPDFTAGTDELLTDQAAYDRHNAFVTTAREALSLCRGHNQIGHVAEHLTIVIDAAGDQPPAMRVDLLVARGERMVDDLGDAVTELQPDPKVALDNLREKRIVNAFKALIRDYIAMIKLDPALDRRQRLPLSDEPSASAVSPQQAIIFVNSSLVVGSITQSARDIIVENTADVPENCDIDNPRTWRFSEIVRNLPRAMVSFLWQNRGKIAGGLATTVAGLGTAAITLITQEVAIRSFFAANPGMLSIIDELTALIRNIGM
jgi:hypothetical protein